MANLLKTIINSNMCVALTNILRVPCYRCKQELFPWIFLEKNNVVGETFKKESDGGVRYIPIVATAPAVRQTAYTSLSPFSFDQDIHLDTFSLVKE